MNKIITDETKAVIAMLMDNLCLLKDEEVGCLRNVSLPKYVEELFNNGETFFLSYDEKTDDYKVYCDNETVIKNISKLDLEKDEIVEASLYREFGDEEHPGVDFDGIVMKYSEGDKSWKMSLNVLSNYDFLTVVYKDKSNKYAIKFSTNTDSTCLFIDISSNEDEYANTMCIELNDEESKMLGDAIMEDFGLNDLEETVD